MNFLNRWRNARPKLLTEGEFVTVYVQHLRAKYPGSEAEDTSASSTRGPRVRWLADDGHEVVQYLGNAYTAYCAQPASRDELFELLRANAAAPIGRADPARLLPLLKSTAWRDASLTQLASTGLDTQDPGSLPFYAHSLAGDLLCVYVQDGEEDMRFASPAQFSALQAEGVDVDLRARQNLEQRIDDITIEVGQGIVGVRLDGNYDASLLLIPGAWRHRVDLPGELLMAVPARDELLVCAAQDVESRRRLRQIARTIMLKSPYRISDQLFGWEDGVLTMVPPGL